MNPVLALLFAPPALEQRSQAASTCQARDEHGVDDVRVFAADISDLGPR